jgi:hypothetical protein
MICPCFPQRIGRERQLICENAANDQACRGSLRGKLRTREGKRAYNERAIGKRRRRDNEPIYNWSRQPRHR